MGEGWQQGLGYRRVEGAGQEERSCTNLNVKNDIRRGVVTWICTQNGGLVCALIGTSGIWGLFSTRVSETSDCYFSKIPWY